MTSVFVTRRIPTSGIELLKREGFNVEVWGEDCPCPYEVLQEKASSYPYLLTQLCDKIDEGILSHPTLKLVSQFAVGTDNINLQLATQHNVIVSHTPGVLTNACADHAFTLMLSAARRIVEGSDYVHEGKWTGFVPDLLLGNDIFGATIGIIGPGRIGSAVAKRATGFDMKILYKGNHPSENIDALGGRLVELEELLRESDFVVCTCPLNDSTRGLIGKAQFEMMKPTAILVNISRGPVVKTDDLVEALQQKKIAGAALDVCDPEPIPSGHPLLSLPNCTIVPHIASATIPTRSKMSLMCAEAIIANHKGERIKTCANPDIYSS